MTRKKTHRTLGFKGSGGSHASVAQPPEIQWALGFRRVLQVALGGEVDVAGTATARAKRIEVIVFSS